MFYVKLLFQLRGNGRLYDWIARSEKFGDTACKVLYLSRDLTRLQSRILLKLPVGNSADVFSQAFEAARCGAQNPLIDIRGQLIGKTLLLTLFQ